MAHFVDSNRQLVIELYVRDLNHSVSFYEQLGFQVGRRDGHFAQLSWDDHHFFLDERTGLPQASELPRVNIRVLVPDVDIHWQQIRDLGIQIISPIANRSYGLRDFIVSDPDGFGVRFATPLATADAY
jgi:catechol 2,3-dioxygenase-like lactoylglutathione lyase family enzyme